MADCLLNYYDWMRTRLGISTTLSLGMEGAKAGEESPLSPEPNNWVLRNYIKNACAIVNQHVGLSGSSQLVTTPQISAVDTASWTGPYSIDLSSMQGAPSRSVISIRRGFWSDGTTSQRMTPVILSDQDNRWSPYMSNAAGTPNQFAIEGYTLFLLPAPASAGYFQFMATTGLLAPDNDLDSFEGIPESYDPCILYIALVEYGKSLPLDAEMSARAQAFTPDAAAGLERLAAWYSMNNEEAQAGVFFNARYMRRNQWAYRR